MSLNFAFLSLLPTVMSETQHLEQIIFGFNALCRCMIQVNTSLLFFLCLE